MNIIFIGVHNKEGLMPLDSLSKTGRIIDRIINYFDLSDTLFTKRNLFDTNEMPFSSIDKSTLLNKFIFDNENLWKENKVIAVCLGNEVYKNVIKFIDTDFFEDIIKIKHPGAICRNGQKAIDNYINETINILKEYVK